MKNDGASLRISLRRSLAPSGNDDDLKMPQFPLDSLSRRLLRQAVLRVHPDVFERNSEAASFNAESLVVRGK